LHARPHALQFLSFESSVTHELPHAVSPEAHLETHFFCEQTSPWWQGCPHAPQLAPSDVVSLHLPLHSIVPAGHAHCPFAHVMPPPHSLPQPPQLWISVAASMHTPAQNVSFWSLHVSWQTPPEQIAPSGHARPHLPQFWESFWVSPQPVLAALDLELCAELHPDAGSTAAARRMMVVTSKDRTRLFAGYDMTSSQVSKRDAASKPSLTRDSQRARARRKARSGRVGVVAESAVARSVDAHVLCPSVARSSGGSPQSRRAAAASGTAT
jgi:hypothetical protein